jgi:transcription-repair coupling factor (superfamily II helicase)
LRGRVGRSRHKAYCYLILPEHGRVNPDARKRLASIREFSQLGAGFQIAMRDLEIRGAGNILGAEQSGHITVVGYDLYCRLLERAVKELRGEHQEDALDVEIDLNLEAHIPEELIPGKSARLELYRRLSKKRTAGEVEEIAREIRDRCGALPEPTQRLLEVQIFRILAAQRGVVGVRHDGDSILLRGSERMRELLESSPFRVVVLGPEEVALVVNDPKRRGPPIELGDEAVFSALFEWFRSGTFPAFRRPAGGSSIRSRHRRPAR